MLLSVLPVKTFPVVRSLCVALCIQRQLGAGMSCRALQAVALNPMEGDVVQEHDAIAAICAVAETRGYSSHQQTDTAGTDCQCAHVLVTGLSGTRQTLSVVSAACAVGIPTTDISAWVFLGGKFASW
jgi:hypothetical protein